MYDVCVTFVILASRQSPRAQEDGGSRMCVCVPLVCVCWCVGVSVCTCVCVCPCSWVAVCGRPALECVCVCVCWPAPRNAGERARAHAHACAWCAPAPGCRSDTRDVCRRRGGAHGRERDAGMPARFLRECASVQVPALTVHEREWRVAGILTSESVRLHSQLSCQ